jgi:hypothetical protein
VETESKIARGNLRTLAAMPRRIAEQKIFDLKNSKIAG